MEEGVGLGLKTGLIGLKRNNAETGRKRDGVGLKIGLMRPKRHTTEVIEEGGRGS